MIRTAATLSEALTSARMTSSCHRTAGPIAKLAKARSLLDQCAPLILKALSLPIPESLDPVPLRNPGFELPQSLFHVAINPADGLLASL